MTSSTQATSTPKVAINDIGSEEAFLAAIDETIKYFNDGDIVEGTVVKVDRDEVLLDIGYKTEGVIPSRELSIKHDVDPHDVVKTGRHIEAQIIELDKNRNNVVLSRRAWLEQTQSEVRHTFLNTLSKGQIRKGVVSSIVNFGAFVDLGGVDGLVHVSELSWKHIA